MASIDNSWHRRRERRPFRCGSQASAHRQALAHHVWCASMTGPCTCYPLFTLLPFYSQDRRMNNMKNMIGMRKGLLRSREAFQNWTSDVSARHFQGTILSVQTCDKNLFSLLSALQYGLSDTFCISVHCAVSNDFTIKLLLAHYILLKYS